MKIKYYGTGDGYGIPEPFCSCRLCAYAREHGGKDIRTRSQAVIDDIMIDFSKDHDRFLEGSAGAHGVLRAGHA